MESSTPAAYLVVGATGIVGGAIARGLRARGRAVRALVRPGSDAHQLEAAGAELVHGDLKDPASLDAACAGVERIVATATAAARGGDDTVESVDRHGYEALVRAADAAGVRRFIYVSAHGFGPDCPVGLGRAKAAAEAAIRASGIEHVILRPVLFLEVWVGMILGAQLEHGDTVTVIGSPDRRYGFVSAADVASLAIAVASEPGAGSETIPLSAEAASYREIVARIAERTGRAIEIAGVEPGTELAGLPPVVVELWSWAAAGGMDDLATPDVFRRFDLAPMGVGEFVEASF